MDDVGVGGAAEPITSPAEGERVDHAILIPSSHFLEEFSGGRIEDAYVDAFLAGSGYLISVECDCD
jgi:hypothetical protein